MTPPSSDAPGSSFHRYPAWVPRFWHGMRFGHWLRLLANNGCRVRPGRWGMACTISLVTPVNSAMYALQRLLYDRRLAATQLRHPPVFIIGHWRSGTTLLHELLVADPQFAFPTTFQCFAPHHVLLTERWFYRYGGPLMPKKRPMDNMRTGWSHPQEDEFALLAMGLPSPYLRIAFPNQPPPDLDWLDMRDLAPQALEAWRQGLLRFVRLLTLRDPRRLVLKSPTHTGRLAVLANLFPGARFIHLTRNPLALFPSTRRLWQALDHVQALQSASHETLDEYIFECLTRMYAGFDVQRAELSPSQLCDVRYEDLVAQPLDVLERLYDQLELGDFQQARTPIAERLSQERQYQVNRHELDPTLEAQIRERWAFYFERYGY